VHAARDRLDRDRAAKTIHRQPPRQGVACGRLAVDQDRLAVRPQEEVEQRLPLGREQPGPLRRLRRDAGQVLRQQPLQKAANIVAGEAQQRAIVEPGAGIVHAEQVGRGKR